MSPGLQVVCSGAISFGIPLAIAIRELLVTRRRPGDGGSRRDPEPAPRPKPLPPELIPQLLPRGKLRERERELELV